MTLDEFAQKYRVKLKRGKQGTEDLIEGKFGEIAEGSTLRLRLLAVPRDKVMNGALNARKKQAAAGGLIPLHVTPNVYESIWGFNSDNDAACRLAIELVCPRKKRTVVLTDAQKVALSARLALARTKTAHKRVIPDENPLQESVL